MPPRTRISEAPQRISTRDPHQQRRNSSDSDPLHHRPITDRSPRLFIDPPLNQRKLGTRISDLESQLGQAQRELKSLKHQLAASAVDDGSRGCKETTDVFEVAMEKKASAGPTPELDVALRKQLQEVRSELSTNDNGVKVLANADGFRLLRNVESHPFDPSRVASASVVKASPQLSTYPRANTAVSAPMGDRNGLVAAASGGVNADNRSLVDVKPMVDESVDKPKAWKLPEINEPSQCRALRLRDNNISTISVKIDSLQKRANKGTRPRPKDKGTRPKDKGARREPTKATRRIGRDPKGYIVTALKVDHFWILSKGLL